MAFFEQIGKAFTDAGQTVAKQTKNFTDVAQLNNAISNKEKQISQLFLRLGQAYYEKHKNEDAAEEQELISEISALYAEIFQNREKIKQIKGVTKCEACGADVPLHAAFCSACGAKVAPAAAEQSKTGRECPVCHAVVPAEDLFCSNCGTKMEHPQETDQPEADAK